MKRPHATLAFVAIALSFLLVSSAAHGQVSTSRKELLRQKKEIEAQVEELLKSGRDTDEQVVRAISQYASILFNLAEYKQALKWQRRLQKIERKTLPKRDTRHLSRLLSLAQCQQALEEEKKARKLVREGIDKAKQWWKGKKRSDEMYRVGIRCHGMSLYDLGREAFEASFEERKKRVGPDDEQTLYAALGVGACWIEVGKPEVAVPILEDTLTRVEEHHPNLGIRTVLRNNLAAVHLQKGEFERAKAFLAPLFEEAKSSGTGGIDWTIRMNYVRALEGLEDYEQAVEHAEAMITDLEVNKRANKSDIDDMKETIRRCKKALRERKKAGSSSPRSRCSTHLT